MVAHQSIIPLLEPKIAVERWGNVIGKLMAFCIAGHHAGLANGNGEGNNRHTLKDRLALRFGADIPVLDNLWQQEIKLPETLFAPPLKADAHHPFFSTRLLHPNALFLLGGC